MSLRCLRIPALLILAFAFPVFAHAQSLGEEARQLRAERQQCPAPHLKVYTNDDLTSSSSEPAGENPSGNGEQNTQAESPAKGKTTGGKTAANPKSSANKDADAGELEIQKRTQEINQEYLGRIAAIQAQIKTAQQELARLQRDKIESSFQYQRSSGTAPSIPQYQEQQSILTQQIDAQQKSITDLNSQLQDAEESARHAGVPPGAY